MAPVRSAPEIALGGEDGTDRGDLLEMHAHVMRTIHEEVEVDTDAKAADQHLQIRWLRTLGQLAGQYRMLKWDSDVDEMADERDLVRDALKPEEEKTDLPLWAEYAI